MPSHSITMKFIVKPTAKLMLLTSLALTSCGGNDFDNSIDYIPVQTEQHGKWGFIDANGDFLFEDEFEQMPAMAVNGYFYAPLQNGITVYKAGKTPEAVPGLDNLMDAGCMTEGRIPAIHKDQRIKYHDKDGKELFTLDPVDGKEIISVCSSFYEGMSGFLTEDKKCGFIDTRGEVVIKPVYDLAGVFSYGMALVMRDSVNMVIDKKENILFKFKNGDQPSTIYKGKVSLRNSDTGQWLIVDVKSKDVTKFGADIISIDWFDRDYAIIRDKNSLCGLADSNGLILIKPRYEAMLPGFSDNFIAYDDGRVSLVNDRGEETAVIGKCDFAAVLSSYLPYYTCMSSSFGGVGFSENGIFLFNEKGERFKDFSQSLIGIKPDLLSRYVTSDYFNVRSAARHFAGLFNSSGFGSISLGQGPASFMNGMKGEPEDFISTDTYELPLLEEGLGYTITARAWDKDRYFVSSREIPDGYYYRTEYQWNPLSSIDVILASLSTVKPGTYPQLRKEFLVFIERKGWKMLKSEDAFCILGKDSMYMMLTPGKEGKSGLDANIYSSEFPPGENEEESARVLYNKPARN